LAVALPVAAGAVPAEELGDLDGDAVCAAPGIANSRLNPIALR
jgi:hypothetical protein